MFKKIKKLIRGGNTFDKTIPTVANNQQVTVEEAELALKLKDRTEFDATIGLSRLNRDNKMPETLMRILQREVEPSIDPLTITLKPGEILVDGKVYIDGSLVPVKGISLGQPSSLYRMMTDIEDNLYPQGPLSEKRVDPNVTLNETYSELKFAPLDVPFISDQPHIDIEVPLIPPREVSVEIDLMRTYRQMENDSTYKLETYKEEEEDKGIKKLMVGHPTLFTKFPNIWDPEFQPSPGIQKSGIQQAQDLHDYLHNGKEITFVDLEAGLSEQSLEVIKKDRERVLYKLAKIDKMQFFKKDDTPFTEEETQAMFKSSATHPQQYDRIVDLTGDPEIKIKFKRLIDESNNPAAIAMAKKLMEERGLLKEGLVRKTIGIPKMFIDPAIINGLNDGIPLLSSLRSMDFVGDVLNPYPVHRLMKEVDVTFHVKKIKISGPLTKNKMRRMSPRRIKKHNKKIKFYFQLTRGKHRGL